MEPPAAAPPPDGGLPRWARRCLAAGAVLLLLAVGGVVAGAHFVRRATDAELQWRRLGRVLPHEHPPEGWKLVGLAPPFLASRAWLASDRGRGLQLLWIERDAGGEPLRALLPACGAAPLQAGGRSLPVARWTSGARAGDPGGGALERRWLAGLLAAVESRPGTACAAVDLGAARTDAQGELLLVAARLEPVPGVVDPGLKRRDVAEPIEDSELADVLASFDIGG